MAFQKSVTSIVAVLAAVLGARAAGAQTALPLQEASSRAGSDFVPVYENRQVTVRGTVSTVPIRIQDHKQGAIQDDDHYGLLLKSDQGALDRLEPGHVIEATGTIVNHAGMPALVPGDIRILSKGAAPQPHRVRLSHLIGFRYMGVLVEVEGEVAGASHNSGGSYINLGDPMQPLRVFLPRPSRLPLGDFMTGDRIRVHGIATQYCPHPPHDKLFEMLIGNAAAVRILERRWLAPPAFLLAILLLLIGALGSWWHRERKMAAQRKAMRALNALSEDILSAESPVDIAARLANALPRIWKLSAVHLYLHNKGSRSLDRVRVTPDAEPFSIPLDSPAGCIGASAALCFRNRTLLAMPDTHRSPFYSATELSKPPRSLLFVPAFSQNEILAVLQMESERDQRQFSREEQAAAEHFGNLVAASLRLQEQLSSREHLFRGERVAASGQLISGVASELGAPLEAIATLTGKLISEQVGPHWEGDLHALGLETLRASEIVARLVTLAKSEKATAETIDLDVLLRDVLTSREREHKLAGIEVRNLTTGGAVQTLGSRVQLEQVLLNLLLHAELAAREPADRTITVGAHTRGKHAVIEISFSAETGAPDDGGRKGSAALGLAVCHGIVQNHGGALRVLRPQHSLCRFEMELPASRHAGLNGSPRGSGKPQRRHLTALVVDPDAGAQRRLVRMLDLGGHRAVPVSGSDEAVELSSRMRFDVSFCAMNVQSLNWVQFFQRVRHNVGAFVLLTEGYDPDLARVFDGGGGYLLNKPVDQTSLDSLLESIAAGITRDAMVGNA